MRKFFKWTAVTIETLIALLIVGIIILPFVLPLEKIKDFATAKISETINREVKIESASFDIFSGIKLKKLYISNREGFTKKPFISADLIELRYAFWPLLSRQLIVKEIRLVKPEVLVEKSVAGEFNFSDLLKKKTRDEGRGTIDDTSIATDKRKTKPAFTLFVNRISLSKGKLTYLEHITKATNVVKDINVGVSGIVLGLLKPIDVKASAVAIYKDKDVPLALSGKVGVDLEKETIKIPNLSLSLAGETLASSGTISNWKKTPQVDISLQSQKFSVDPLLAVFVSPPGAKKIKPKPGELTKTVNRSVASIPRNLIVNCDLNIDNLTFQKFKADRIKLALSLSNKKISSDIKEIKIYGGTLSGRAKVDLTQSGLGYQVSDLKLSGFNASPFSNAVVETFLTNLPDYQDLVNKVYGILDVSLSGSGGGVEVSDIMGNLVASGSFSLRNGELKRLKTIDAIADKIKTPALKQDLKISEVSGGFSIRGMVVDVKNLSLKDSDIGVAFDGGLDLGGLKFAPGNRLTLKGSPSLTKTVPAEFNIFRDDKGWLELTFELTGSLKKPIPIPRLEKPIEKAVGKIKAKIEAEKIEIEEKTREELKQKEEEARKALEEEAKKKLKEMIKF